MTPDFYRALESVSIALALSAAFTIYPSVNISKTVGYTSKVTIND